MTDVYQSIADRAEILSDSGVVVAGQKWRLQRTYSVRLAVSKQTIKLLVELEHDSSYPAQSRYRISKWDGNQWQVVVRRDPESPEMKNLTSSYGRGEKQQQMINDADRVAYDLLIDALRVII
jgi:hypothetical protein